jgi:hypothetical protein
MGLRRYFGFLWKKEAALVPEKWCWLTLGSENTLILDLTRKNGINGGNKTQPKPENPNRRRNK